MIEGTTDDEASSKKLNELIEVETNMQRHETKKLQPTDEAIEYIDFLNSGEIQDLKDSNDPLIKGIANRFIQNMLRVAQSHWAIRTYEHNKQFSSFKGMDLVLIKEDLEWAYKYVYSCLRDAYTLLKVKKKMKILMLTKRRLKGFVSTF